MVVSFYIGHGPFQAIWNKVYIDAAQPYRAFNVHIGLAELEQDDMVDSGDTQQAAVTAYVDVLDGKWVIVRVWITTLPLQMVM